jgi:hypothetical protein
MKRLLPLVAVLILLAPSVRAAVEEKKTLTWDFPAKGGPPVMLDVLVGEIRVVADEKERVRIKATRTVRAETRDRARQTLDETAVQVQLRDQGIQLADRVPRNLQRGGRSDAPAVSLKVEVHVPPGSVLMSRIGVGETRIDGAFELLDLQSTTGSIRLERQNLTRSGRVTIGVGDLSVRGRLGNFQAGVGTGRITAKEIDAGAARSVALKAGVGAIDAGFRSLPQADLSVIGGTGNVRVRVPGDSRGDATVTATTGAVRSSFGLGRRPQGVGAVGGTLYGPIGGGGGTTIRVQTGTGDAALERG